MPLVERFAAQSIPEPYSGCWLWIGATNNRGYGRIKVNDQSVYAHRASWEMHVGQIPPALCVMHKCDTPSCVNPAHLSLGTHAENMGDMGRKGRAGVSIGERNGQAKLNDEQVRAIRADRRPQQEIAASYGVAPSRISEILAGKTRNPK